MRLFLHLALLLGWLPALAGGSLLTSVQSSYHATGNFAILVLRFDGPFTHHIQETEDGQSVLLKLVQCQAAADAPAQLSSLNNALVDQAQLETAAEMLTVRLRFRAPMKLKVSRTQNPYSLILDVAPLTKSLAPTGRKNVATSPKSPGKKAALTPAKPKPKESQPAVKTYADWLSGGKNMLAQKQEREALETFQQATRQFPDSAEAHYWLGLLLRKWGQPEAAIEHFQKAKTDSLFFIQASTELASIYHLLRLTAEEVAEWEGFFNALRRANPTWETIADDSLPEREPDVELVVGQEVEPPATLETSPPAPRTGIPTEWALLAIIILLFAVILFLFLKQRDLNRTIANLLQQDEEETVVRRKHKPDSTSPEPPAFQESRSDESGSREERHTTEMAREVLGLYRAGISIPAIAERLKMGQDEVRLILNLVKEESSKA